MQKRKTTRDALGNIKRKELTIAGKKVIRFDARKRYNGPDGKQKEKFKRCLTKAEAQIALANFSVEIQDELSGKSTPSNPQAHTFCELLDYFGIEYLKPAVFSGDRQLGGYRQKLSRIQKYLDDYRDFFPDKAVADFTYEDMRRYAEHLAITPIDRTGPAKLPAAATINRKLSYLRRLFNVAIQLTWRDTNPFKLGSKALINTSAEKPRERILTFEEERRLIAACEGPDVFEYDRWDRHITATMPNRRLHLRLLVIMAIDTGMRKSEMLNLKRSQIDFDAGVITIEATQTKALKTRFVPLSDRLDLELRTHIETADLASSDLVFGGIKDCKKSFSTACKRAGIEGLTFHDLRHTAATWMDQAGITQAVRMNVVGHTTANVHQRYTNVSADILRATRNQMSAFRLKLEEKERSAAA